MKQCVFKKKKQTNKTNNLVSIEADSLICGRGSQINRGGVDLVWKSWTMTLERGYLGY